MASAMCAINVSYKRKLHMFFFLLPSLNFLFPGLPLFYICMCVCVRQFVEHTYVSGRGKPVPTHTHTQIEIRHKLVSAD